MPNLAHEVSTDQQMTVMDVMLSKPTPKKSETDHSQSLEGLTESDLQQMLLSEEYQKNSKHELKPKEVAQFKFSKKRPFRE